MTDLFNFQRLLQLDVPLSYQRIKKKEGLVTRKIWFQANLCSDLGRSENDQKVKKDLEWKFVQYFRNLKNPVKYDAKDNLKLLEVEKSKLEKVIQVHRVLNDIERELQQQCERIHQQMVALRNNFMRAANGVRGLSPQRIRKFQSFQADQSLVGDRCEVCLADIELGRSMIRLDCGGQHFFCKGCVEGWLANNNTCPKCRHTFA